jgi:Ca2+-binding RTX toxin-like protein
MTVFNGTPTNDSLPGAGQDFSGDNTIRGLAGNDTINAGTGNDIVEGGAGNDWLDGGAGRDTADYSYVTVNMAATLQAEGQTTTISISTVTGAEDIDRLTNIENLAGGLGNDSLTGNDAANVLSGGSGNDTLSGGAGGQDTLIGGTGIDTAVFVGGAVVVALDRHGNATASGGDTDVLVGIENLTGSASGSDRLSGNASDNVLIGLGGNDVLLGGGGNDTIHGEDANWTGTGADSISGGDGNDFISGGRGNDTMDGGAGNDTLSYTGETRDVLITYTATATGAPTLGATITGGEVDVIRGFEAFRGGSGNDTFRLEKSINADLDLPALYFDGGAGQNTLDLSGLFAGLAQGSIAGGKTTIRLANSSQQTILETTGLNARAERLTVDNIQNLVGTSFDDDVTGTAGANRIDGGAGNDTIRGEGGADTLIGGTGDDVFYIASPDAIIVEVSGEGTDTVFANTTFFRLGSNVENLTLSKGGVAIGSDVANQITGSSSADTLEGGAGADTINGGFGNDFATYRSSSNGVVVTLRDDTVQVAQIGGDAQGDVLISIEHLEGSAFSDILTGNKGANILVGGAGNDVLDGGAGNDWADYRSATTGVQIDLRRDVQVGGDAQGDVFISIEGIRGSAFNDTLIGNDADNLFDGAAGADAINGLGGIDTVTYATSAAGVKVSLRGGQTGSGGDAEGDTWFNIENVIGSSHADSFESGSERGVVYFFDGGNGQDVITFENAGSGATVNLSITAEQRTGTGNGQVRLNDIEGAIGSNFGDSLTGNASGNALSGGAGHDTLVGGGGEDTLTGGTGNDVLTGDGLNLRTEQYRQDTFVFVAGGGNDTIADFGLGTGVQARDKLDFKAFGWTAGDLRLTTDNTAGLTEAAFNADNNIKIALIQRTSLTEDWRFMYRDGESTATLTIKHANQNIVWSATDHFIFT